jgi:putative ribosome biogenesis GTPase RsgA
MNNLVTKASELIYQMDNGQLNEVIEAVKLKRQHLSRQATRDIMVGDIVGFEGRRGQRVSGKVVKVNQKTLVVLDSKTQTRWKVSGTLVSKLGIGEDVTA